MTFKTTQCATRNCPSSCGWISVTLVCFTIATVVCVCVCVCVCVVKRHTRQPLRRRCFLYRNSTIVEQPIDLPNLTSKLVADAKAFIHEQQKSNPFFLVFSLPQPHVPMFNRPEFRRKSKRGTCSIHVYTLPLSRPICKVLQTQTRYAFIFGVVSIVCKMLLCL